MRYLWAGITGIAAVFLSILVAHMCKGKNYSDVGVPMYTHGDFGFLAGLAAYGVILFLGFTFLKRVFKLHADSGSAFIVVGAILLAPAIYLLRWLT